MHWFHYYELNQAQSLFGGHTWISLSTRASFRTDQNRRLASDIWTTLPLSTRYSQTESGKPVNWMDRSRILRRIGGARNHPSRTSVAVSKSTCTKGGFMDLEQSSISKRREKKSNSLQASFMNACNVRASDCGIPPCHDMHRFVAMDPGSSCT